MMNLAATPVTADPAVAAAVTGGAQASSATDGNSSAFSRTLNEVQTSDPADDAAIAPRAAATSTSAGQPAAATIAAPPGETVPPGRSIAATEMPLLAAQAGTAVSSGTVGEVANDILDDADPSGEPAGDASLQTQVSNDLANAGLQPVPVHEVNVFLHQAVTTRAPAPDAQLSAQPDVQTAAAATADALVNANAPTRAEAELMAVGKPQVAGADAATLARSGVAFSQSAAEKGGDAPSHETGEPLGLSLSDLGVRDSVPRGFAADGRDTGALAPHRPGFADALGQRIAWFARNDGGNATLELDPPHLGPLEVSVRVDKGETSVVFVASQASVRDAVSQALPELRNLFAQSGLSLGDVNVSAGGAGHQAFASQYASPWNRLSDASAESAVPVPLASVQHGLVDLYA